MTRTQQPVSRRMRWAYAKDPTQLHPPAVVSLAAAVARLSGWRVDYLHRLDAPGLSILAKRPRASQRRWLRRGTVRRYLALAGFVRLKPASWEAEVWGWVAPDLGDYADAIARRISDNWTLALRFGQ